MNQGQILLQDKAIEENGQVEITVRQALKKEGLKTKIATNGNIWGQIKGFGAGLLLPKSAFSFKTFKNDKRLLLMSIVGLGPAFVIKFTGATYLTFYAIALYFSMIWGLFFFYVFKTDQVKTRTTVIIFFATQVIIFILVDVLRFTEINPLYQLTKSRFFLNRVVGFVFGVGVFEELIKAIPLFYLAARSKEPQQPQTIVFYGLISGIGFGVFEGVMYQITVNSKLGYNESFFMNIARLTSLPFLHAIWAGIAGYFISMSFLFPKNRQSLWVLSIAIPAVIHGLYDVLGWSIPGLAICFIGVGLLVIYLQRAKDFQNKLIT